MCVWNQIVLPPVLNNLIFNYLPGTTAQVEPPGRGDAITIQQHREFLGGRHRTVLEKPYLTCQLQLNNFITVNIITK